MKNPKDMPTCVIVEGTPADGRAAFKRLCGEIRVREGTKRAFLGGTCNESTWRDRLIPITEAQLRSLDAVWRMVRGNGAATFADLEAVAAELNNYR